jgi:hypothetical protein
LRSIHDNENIPRFDLKRPGERPVHDNGVDDGDFISPSDSVIDPIRDTVAPRGDGADPEGLDYSDPPTGGETGGI